ncbi:MAG: hydrogenase maturation protease [Balneolaceae bacterium]|nr:MAG: hydrogenase maturation protease [Balneolaceae bacterium]
MKKTAVIGIGNTLMSDDGAGVRVLEHLDDLPDHVSIVELAAGGMILLHHLEDYDCVIIADAVDFGGEPGEIRVFSPDEVRTIKTVGYSLHDLDILKVLELAAKLGMLPESVRIAAIQPASLEMKEGLTPPVEAALPKLARKISEQVTGLVKDDPAGDTESR